MHRRFAPIALLFFSLSLSSTVWSREDVPNLQSLKDRIVAYHKSGQWDRDTERVVGRAEHALETGLRKKIAGKPAIVFDIDETALSNWEIEEKTSFGYIPDMWSAWERAGTAVANKPVLDLYKYARAHNVQVFFITGRHESSREGTDRNLKAVGFTDFVELVMKPENYHGAVVPYKSAARKAIIEKGYRILVNIGDQESDLDGGFSETRFKVPNPMYVVK
jgi:predicted secreted acid phosphatase